MTERTLIEQTVFRFGYATSLWRGAVRIKDAKDLIAVAAAPAYLLIGFAIENALAAYLIAHKHPNCGRQKHTGDPKFDGQRSIFT